jgi:KaiC/GvpD/RAD55 family RecA-like ATPase
MNEERSILTSPDLTSVWDTEAKVEWIVDGMIPEGSVNLISAESGTGKTWFAYAMAGAVARGEPFLGLTVKQMPVLYIDGENPLALVKNRLSNLVIPKIANLGIWGGWAKEPPPGPSEKVVEVFARESRGLIIWDSLIEFHTGEESSATDTRKYMKDFRKLANSGATILLLHHTGKSGTSKRYRGSSDIKAAVDTAYLLTKGTNIVGSDRLRHLKMTNFKSRFAEGRNFQMEFTAGKGFCAVGDSNANDTNNDAVLGSLITNEPINGTKFKLLARARGISREAAEAFLKVWPHQMAGSKPNEKLYYRPQAA